MSFLKFLENIFLDRSGTINAFLINFNYFIHLIGKITLSYDLYLRLNSTFLGYDLLLSFVLYIF